MDPKPLVTILLISPPSIAMCVFIFNAPVLKIFLIPLRSPKPSSPTVAANKMSDSVLIDALFIAFNTVSIMLSARVSSPIPGANSVSPLILTVTSVSKGKTVSRCASISTVFPFPFPFLKASTLPA